MHTQRTSSRIRRGTMSATAQLAETIARVQTQGRRVIDLAQGEVADIPPPPAALEAAHMAIREHGGKYTPPGGTPHLRRAIATWFEREQRLQVAAGEVIVSPGAKFAVYTFLMTVLDDGDEVLVPSPYWTSYLDQVRLAGGTPRVVTTRPDDGFKVTPEALEEAVTSRTRVLVLNNPNNPSGAVYTRPELESLLAVIRRHGLLVLADEVYSQLTYDAVSHHCFAALHPDAGAVTVTVSAASKTFCMTGWRIGFAAGPRDLIAGMEQVQSHTTSCPNTIAQSATRAALEDQQSFVADLRRRLDERRRFVMQALRDLPEVECQMPQGAFYAFPSVRPLVERLGLTDATALVPLLLDATGVLTAAGSGFGMPYHLRICFGASMASLEEGMALIAGWIDGRQQVVPAARSRG